MPTKTDLIGKSGWYLCSPDLSYQTNWVMWSFGMSDFILIFSLVYWDLVEESSPKRWPLVVSI
jgi:hypothetical protein